MLTFFRSISGKNGNDANCYLERDIQNAMKNLDNLNGKK
ncbi:hypothetical protein GM3708_388 [Geminocystis sp. NIES-3708]|nr:hypothetical protein GM3708_388 [Geminocystis sp. NIES-3708]